MLRYLFSHLEEWLGAIIMTVMVTLAFANVVTRYVITYPMAFTEEITISMFVWVTLLGASIAFRQNAHLSVTFVYDNLPQNARKICLLITNAMCIAFFSLLVYLGSHQVLDEMELNVTSQALAIPTWLYTGAVPLFSLLVIVRIIQSAVGQLRSGNY
ncbi:MAG: TRAP transporter small permease [Deltaproteobacteria bacterium]|nr:TRAP transporter small permease [Deltaproteobacteria bacterium]